MSRHDLHADNANVAPIAVNFVGYLVREAFARRPRGVQRCAVSQALSAPLSAAAKIASLLAIACCFWTGLSLGQSPGDFPDVSAMQRAAATKSGQAEGLPINAFMVLDQNGNLIYLPGMTYERWRELETGADSENQAIVIEPLEIRGTANDGRAELELKLELTVDPTDGQYISIPLKMANFFLIRAPEFGSAPKSAEGDSQYIQPSKDGMVLKVRSVSRRKLTVRMSVSALVQSGPPRLDFQLPDLPANIQISTDAVDVVGEVIGSGSEVLQTKKLKNRGTRFDVSTGGGSLTLQWSPSVGSTDTSSLIESDSVMQLDWGSPVDQPIASVTLSLRNMRDLRGPIEWFDVDLPPGSVLLDTPVLEAKDQAVSIEPVKGKSDRVRITIPEQERSQRVAVRLELQLQNDKATEQKPLNLQVPRIVGALRQQGEIQLKTSNSYRLRWRSSSWVRSFLNDDSGESTSARRYQFRFDRGDFTLPIWLSANKRQLLANSDSIVTIRDDIASLEMEIQFNGNATDSRSLDLDLFDWRLRAVIDADTDDTLPWFETNQRLSIEMNTSEETLPPIMILAQRSIVGEDAEAKQLAFQMPRIIQNDKSLAIGSNNVTVKSTSSSTFVIDLEESSGLERMAVQTVDDEPTIAVSQFRILGVDNAPRIVGAMIRQPPQITLTSRADVVLSGDQLTTSMDWTVQPRTDLAGTLPVRVPSQASRISPKNEPASKVTPEPVGLLANNVVANGVVANGVDTNGVDTTETDASNTPPVFWSVTVDNVAAQLVAIDGERFRLVSDRLGVAPVVIRWRRQDLIPQSELDDEIRSIRLPVPALADVTVEGDVVVSTQGDSVTSLFAADTTSQTRIQFQAIPDRVRIRMTKLSADQNDLAIRKAVLRSAVGSNSRYEQFLALIQGGDSLDLSLPDEVGDVRFEAKIDQKNAAVSRNGNRLRLSLPGDSQTHRVDLRIWVDEPSGRFTKTIAPVLQLPIRVGRVYWQVATPRDSHVVWAAPTVGRAMDWQFNFDSWSLSRTPIYNDTSLTQWVGVSGAGAMPPGNRYLYIGSDVRSFSVCALSRATLWLLVGGFLLLFTSLLRYVPSSRNPLTAVTGAVFFAGLVAVAPDAAVLAGQLSVVALILVLVMLAVAALIRKPSTALNSAAELGSVSATRSAAPAAPSTRTLQVDPERQPFATESGVSATSEASS